MKNNAINQSKFLSPYEINAEQIKEFQNIRDSIDQIDLKILDLIMQRHKNIERAKILKQQFYPKNKSYITPGRESGMMLDLFEQAKSRNIPIEEIFSLWRNFISFSDLRENNIIMQVCKNELSNRQLEHAKHYFGHYVDTNLFNNIEELLHETEKTESSIAVVPFRSNWWSYLYHRKSELKVFAAMPFIIESNIIKPETLFIANIRPEPLIRSLKLPCLEETLFVVNKNVNQYFDVVDSSADLLLVSKSGFSSDDNFDMFNLGAYACYLKNK